MKLLEIYLSEDDIDFFIKAVKSHSQQIVDRLEAQLRVAPENNQCQQKNETFRSEPSETFRSAIIGAISGASKPTAVYAPYGLKKDGTASKRRGRPAFKTKKVTA